MAEHTAASAGTRDRRDRFLEFLFITLIAAAIVFGTICGIGTINSGWHLVDDHEYAEYIVAWHNGMTIPELIQKYCIMDFSRRFRPLYYPLRIILTWFVGENLVVYSVIRAFVVIADIVLLYYVGRTMHAGKKNALLFSLISMIGYQSAVWWKLGPQEDLGTLFFAAGFLFFLKWLEGGKKAYAWSSALLFLLMALYKEVFILLFPFLVCYILYDSIKNTQPAGVFSFGKLKGKRIYIIFLVTVFVVLISTIFTLLHPVTIGSSEGGAADKIENVLSIWKGALSEDLKWYKYFGLLLVAILLTYWEKLKKRRKEIILFLSFIIPVCALYCSTKMIERYILPFSIGFSLFFLILIPRSDMLSGKRKKMYYAMLILMLVLYTRGMLIEADYFRYRGNSVTVMMQEVEKASEKEHLNVMSCLGISNPEADITIEYWLESKGEKNIYYWDEGKKAACKVRPYQNETDAVQYPQDQMDVIVAFNRDDRHFLLEPSIDLTDYTLVKCGTINLYYKKGLELPHIQIKPSLYY
jgi:hypothetical protein